MKNFIKIIKIAIGFSKRLAKTEKAIKELKETYDKIILVSDYDGALNETNYQLNPVDELGYFTSSILPCKNDDLDAFSVNHNIYSNIRTLETTKFFAELFSKEDFYILTRSDKNVEAFKEEAILAKFNIDREHIIHVRKSTEKTAVLERLYEEETKENEKVLILFLEDDLGACLRAEESLNSKTHMKVKSIHTSHVIK